MAAVKYLTSIVVFTIIARGFGVTEDVAVLGYCILTAGWIADKK